MCEAANQNIKNGESFGRKNKILTLIPIKITIITSGYKNLKMSRISSHKLWHTSSDQHWKGFCKTSSKKKIEGNIKWNSKEMNLSRIFSKIINKKKGSKTQTLKNFFVPENKGFFALFNSWFRHLSNGSKIFTYNKFNATIIVKNIKSSIQVGLD